jgi:hypothetical protein
VSSSNADFSFAPTWREIIDDAGLPDEAAPTAQRLAEALERRDREIEDHVNEAVRRHVVQREAGDGTTKSGDVWSSVAPAVVASFPKARRRSALVVDVTAVGTVANAAGGWVEFGVQVLDGGGSVLVADVAIVRVPWVAAQDGTVLVAHGATAVAGAGDGPVQVRLRVRCDDAGSSWTSHDHGTNCIKVTESR